MTAPPRLSRSKLLLFRLLLLLMPLLALELALRGYLAFRVGPDLLLYGTPFSRGMSMRTPRVRMPFLTLWMEFLGCPSLTTACASGM